jgi:hypothetical protein
VLAATASAAFAKHLELSWVAALGLAVSAALVLSPPGGTLRAALGPGLRRLAVVLGTACALGAARLVGLVELRRLGVSYDHALDRRGAFWFPAPGTTWSFPSPDLAARGTDQFRGGRFYEGLGPWVEGLLNRVPAEAVYRTQFGRPGPPLDHEYAWLGLTVVGVMLAAVGLLRLRHHRGLIPLLVVGAVCALISLGPHLPPDFHFLLTEGVPGVGAFAQPIKYWNVFILFAAVLAAGAGFQALARGRNLVTVGLMVALLLPAWTNSGALRERFAEPRETLFPAAAFDQLALIDDTADASLPAEQIEARERAHFLRAFARSAGASEYDLAAAGTGLITWYGTLSLPEHAVPARYVTPEGEEVVNPRYRGEASFDGSGRVEDLLVTPNAVTIRLSPHEGGTLRLNQEALRASDWRSSAGLVTAEGGLLAVEVQAGVQEVVLRYRPRALIGGLAASAVALLLWFGLVLPRRWLAVPAAAVVVGLVLWPDPATPPSVLWEHTGLQAGSQTELSLKGTAGNRALPAGTEVRVGFPHWVYGAHVEPPPKSDGGRFGHWYLVQTLQARVPAGGSFEVSLGPVRVPPSAGPAFHPLVWIAGRLVEGLDDGRIEAGAPVRAVVLAPAAVSPGAPFEVRVWAEDEFGNRVGASRVEAHPGFATAGMHRVTGSVEGLAAEPVPVLVEASPPRIIWADLHGHSGLSDGRGTPAAYFAEARKRGLDAVALSDHDWQLDDAEWGALLDAVQEAHEPGRFVTIPAAEVNLAGHEVAYFFDVDRLRGIARGAQGGARTIWEETDRGRVGALPPDLVGEYGSEGLVVATHSSLAANMGTGFPLAEPLPQHVAFEVYSAHGSSECETCARRVGGGPLLEGEAVGTLHDALDAGMRPALLAAGDGHDGRPGDPAWGGFPGGLAGLEVDELTREGVLAALQAGRIWGTTGERTVLQVRWEEDGTGWVRVVAAGTVEAIEVIGGRQVIARIDEPPQGVWLRLDELPKTDWRYVRVLLPDGARAWGGTWFALTTLPSGP